MRSASGATLHVLIEVFEFVFFKVAVEIA